jgi:hypothetical protein
MKGDSLMPKYRGSLLRDGKPFFKGTIDLKETDAPTHKPMGFRAPPPIPPKLQGTLFFERAPNCKKDDLLRFVRADGKESDGFIFKVAEITGVYMVIVHISPEFT